MDSDWKCLVDEMFQSYLCEEDESSFYEPSSTDTYPSIHESDGVELDEGLLLEETNQDCGGQLENWDPLDNLFDLLEEVVLFDDVEEKYEEKCNSDLKSPSYGDLKTKKSNETKKMQDSATNTENNQKKTKSGKKRKREGNQKNSPEDYQQKKK